MSGLQSTFRRFLSSLMGSNGSISKQRHYIGETTLLQDGQMQEAIITIGGEKAHKVLLSRISGQYYATSHLCTHYKARLVTGVLSKDGRLSCPWHAACFKVQTGDIEEAPAVEALKTFTVQIEDEKIYVLADSEGIVTLMRRNII